MNQIKFETLNKPRSYYGSDEPKEFSVQFRPSRCGTYVIDINAVIEDVSQFATAIQVLGLAKEDDEVEIHLQCPGGNIDASGAFLHALRKCQAPIHIVASGGVHSAATHILLDADSFELAENFNSLIHNGSSVAGGNINEYHAKSDFDKTFIYKTYESIYEGFLSPSEFKDMMRGDNIWLDASQWHDRAMKRSEYFRAKFEKQMKTQQRKPRAKKSLALSQET
jgi:ATP-dependent protease ClpP protease subunit